MHEILETITTSHVTSNYKSTEQKGEPHSDLSLVLVNYSLQTTGSLLLGVMRVRNHDDTYQETLKQKYLQYSYSMSFVFLAIFTQ